MPARQLAQAMQLSPDHSAVCFLDDRADLQRKIVAGLPVYSPSALADAIFRHELEQIVLAIPSASSAQKRRLIERVEGAGLPVKILPGLFELVDGKAGISDIREVDVADLLGRDPVPPDPALFARNIAGKVVLVTGAGGSIGSELCRQIASQRPAKLLLARSLEFALYTIDHELRESWPGIEVVACLGSVLDERLMRALLRSHRRPDDLSRRRLQARADRRSEHAARAAATTSSARSSSPRAALEAEVETCILISTDKAVRPTNVMGASKRAAELIFQAAALRSGTRTMFSMVRFGNVLGSSGSVVPLFRRQIEAGGPVTITHPDIIRYFMLDRRGGPARRPVRSDGARRRRLRARHGRAGPDRRPGANDDPPVGPDRARRRSIPTATSRSSTSAFVRARSSTRSCSSASPWCRAATRASCARASATSSRRCSTRCSSRCAPRARPTTTRRCFASCATSCPSTARPTR